MLKVKHQRGRGAVWKLNSGGFGRGGKSLVLEAERELEAGETITMDFGPEKLDADLLLNYGVMDDFVTQVQHTAGRLSLHCSIAAPTGGNTAVDWHSLACKEEIVATCV